MAPRLIDLAESGIDSDQYRIRKICEDAHKYNCEHEERTRSPATLRTTPHSSPLLFLSPRQCNVPITLSPSCSAFRPIRPIHSVSQAVSWMPCLVLIQMTRLQRPELWLLSYLSVASQRPSDRVTNARYQDTTLVSLTYKRYSIWTYPLKMPKVQANGVQVRLSRRLHVSVLEQIACSRSSSHLAIGNLAIRTIY